MVPLFKIPPATVLSSTMDRPMRLPLINPAFSIWPKICESFRIVIAVPADEIIVPELTMSPSSVLSLTMRLAAGSFIVIGLMKLSFVVASARIVASKLIVTLSTSALVYGSVVAGPEMVSAA